MDEKIIALAIEALEHRKVAIQAEIDGLKRGGRRAAIHARQRSAASREAQSARMKAYWAKKRAEAKKPSRTRKAKATKKPGPQSAASRKAISERMKAYWAKRKALQAKGSE